MKYSKKEVFEASKEYFGGDELAADVVQKYLLRDRDGNFLEKTPDDMHERLAKEFARIESKYPNSMSRQEIFELFRNFRDVIPQGSPMSAIGNEHQVQSLSNCFVIDSPEDSYGGILFTDQEQVQIMKRRGGVGFDISKIRPSGMTTSNAARTTDGIAVFMERFSNTCREVAQGGRRGALMLCIDCRHPDIETFIDIKRDLTKVTGANISIKFTDEFMCAVENNENFTLQWPVDVPPENASIRKVVPAKMIWDKFVDSAWTSAEPGALFWDTITKNTPTDAYERYGFKSIATNPCSEIVLCAYDSCRLLAINLSSFVIDPFLPTARFDFDRFGKVAKKSQRLMDDLVDLEIEAVDRIIAKIEADPQSTSIKGVELDLWKKIRQKGVEGRRTGLGITALGDTLAMLGQKYGDVASVKTTEDIYKCLAINAYESSIELASERGAFPVFDFELEKDHGYLSRIRQSISAQHREMWAKTGRRNIALTTTAPVGSVSTLTKTTSGIEPAFLLSYKRRRKLVPGDEQQPDFIDKMGDRWQEYVVYHHAFKQWMDTTGKKQVEDSPYWGATANDIDWVKSIDVQAAAQRWIDHSLSKTCNLPNDVEKSVVSDVYLRAWKSGCKGVTIYRDGSRSGVLVQNDAKPDKQAQERATAKRKKNLPCDIHRLNVKGYDGQVESWLALVGLNDGKPYEVFCGMAQHIEVPKKVKSGVIVKNGKINGIATYNLKVPFGDDDEIVFKDIVELFKNPMQGALTRTVSLALRHEIPLHFIVDQIQKDKGTDMFAFSKCLARVLKAYIPDGTKTTGGKQCEACGSDALVYMEGCVTCSSCGSSKCG